LILSFTTVYVIGQTKDFTGTRTIEKDGKIAIETIPAENKREIESLNDHTLGMNDLNGEKYVLGGSVLWSTQDPVAIANVVAINSAGNSALTGWGLNSMRATLYSDVNNTPLWDFPTEQYDPFVDISIDGLIIAPTTSY